MGNFNVVTEHINKTITVYGHVTMHNPIKIFIYSEVYINILPLVEGVTVDYHKKKKCHPRRSRG